LLQPDFPDKKIAETRIVHVLSDLSADETGGKGTSVDDVISTHEEVTYVFKRT